jgi:dGTPase
MDSFLAKYASTQENCRGRLHVEESPTIRSPYQRDRDRIIHSNTFRRLKHKTQVFVFHEGDYYRTRLTHSIEVAQIARSMARALRVNEDLAEALSLAHDFGHTAFGHAGEEALDEVMQPYGGFDHNAQSLRLVTSLEERYASFQGLNLTWETLEGLAKHNGPLVDKPLSPADFQAGKGADLPFALREYFMSHDLMIHTHAGLEAQIAALSDDIAYDNHDIEDGLRAKLFTLEDLGQVPFVGEIIDEVRSKYHNIAEGVLIHELVRRIINRMVNDVLIETGERLEALNPQHPDDIRHAGQQMVDFSSTMKANEKGLKKFLWESMYYHDHVNQMKDNGKKVVTELFNLYIQSPNLLPPEWESKTNGPEDVQTARVTADFIAGMTDRFALQEHEKLIVNA